MDIINKKGEVMEQQEKENSGRKRAANMGVSEMLCSHR